MKTTAWIVILTLLTLCAPLPLVAEKTASNQINWSTYAEAEAKNNGDRKYIIYFYSDQCPACVQLKKHTFSEKSIVDYINANYTPIKVNIGKEPKVAARFRVHAIPDLRFLGPKGEDITKWLGFVDSKQLLMMLQYIDTDSYKEISYKDFISQKKGQ